jgi:hypothetical protein
MTVGGDLATSDGTDNGSLERTRSSLMQEVKHKTGQFHHGMRSDWRCFYRSDAMGWQIKFSFQGVVVKNNNKIRRRRRRRRRE